MLLLFCPPIFILLPKHSVSLAPIKRSHNSLIEQDK